MAIYIPQTGLGPAAAGASQAIQGIEERRRRRRDESRQDRLDQTDSTLAGNQDRREQDRLGLDREREARIAKEMAEARKDLADERARIESQRGIDSQAIATTAGGDVQTPYASNRDHAMALLRTGKLSPDTAQYVVTSFANQDKFEALKGSMQSAIQQAQADLGSGAIGSSMDPENYVQARESSSDIAISTSLQDTIAKLTKSMESMDPNNVRDLNAAAASLDGFMQSVAQLKQAKIKADQRNLEVNSFVKETADVAKDYKGTRWESDFASFASQAQTDENADINTLRREMRKVKDKADGWVPHVTMHGIDVEDKNGELKSGSYVSRNGWRKIKEATAAYVAKNPTVLKMAQVDEAAMFELDMAGADELGVHVYPADALAKADSYISMAMQRVKASVDEAVQKGEIADAAPILEQAYESISQSVYGVLDQKPETADIYNDELAIKAAHLIGSKGYDPRRATEEVLGEMRSEQAKIKAELESIRSPESKPAATKKLSPRKSAEIDKFIPPGF
jgi:hypothetical protein